MKVRSDDHCPKFGMRADYVTHNIVEIVVYVCDRCDVEWPVERYEEMPTVYPPVTFLGGAV